jgi:hypothetical protein
MDIFVEPVLPKPRLLILGASPVAVALAAIAPTFGYAVAVAAVVSDLAHFPEGVERIEGLAPPPAAGAGAFVVVSTQGSGDRAALTAAAAMPARYRAFVGSRRKAETLRRELASEGVPPDALAGVKAPAGLDIAAVTSEEIALSILAEVTAVRRRLERSEGVAASSSGVSMIARAALGRGLGRRRRLRQGRRDGRRAGGDAAPLCRRRADRREAGATRRAADRLDNEKARQRVPSGVRRGGRRCSATGSSARGSSVAAVAGCAAEPAATARTPESFSARLVAEVRHSWDWKERRGPRKDRAGGPAPSDAG